MADVSQAALPPPPRRPPGPPRPPPGPPPALHLPRPPTQQPHQHNAEVDAAVQAAVLAEQEAAARQQLALGSERKRPLDEGDAERDGAHCKVCRMLHLTDSCSLHNLRHGCCSFWYIVA